MKHSKASKPEGSDDAERPFEGSGVTMRSGIRRRGAQALANDAPCTSFEEVHRRYRPFMWGKIRSSTRTESDAEDVFQKVQETLIRWVRDNDVPHPVAPLLTTMIENELKNHIRVRNRQRTDDEPDEDVPPSSQPDPERLLARAESRAALKAKVEAAFARMTPQQVELILLAHTDGLTLEDMAAITGQPQGTVGVHLYRARRKLRELVAPWYNLREGSRRKPAEAAAPDLPAPEPPPPPPKR